MTTSAVRKLVTRAGEEARLGSSVHPHMLRHAAGYELADDGHDTRAIQHYLRHKNIQHTVRYAELASNRFKNFCRDCRIGKAACVLRRYYPKIIKTRL